MAKGIDFEIKALKYLRSLFEYLGFRVTAERQQDTGTQNGFDLRISFFDDNGKLRHFYFECKDYNTTLYWKDLLTKIIELNTSRHQVDGFIAMSPHVDLSNIHSNINDHLPTLVKFPIEFWTPESSVKNYFSLGEDFYSSIYGRKPKVTATEKERIRQDLRAVVLDMLRQKDQLALANTHTTFPKELTSKIPRIHQHDIIGREDELQDLHTLLFNNKQVVVVNGMGGIGKTILSQAYLSKYYDDYHHIAWVSQLTNDIANDIVSASGLAENLSVSKENKEVNQVFDEILRRLKACSDGPNLLILDNAEEALTKLKDILPGQPDWHLLITSRHRIEGFYPKELDFLSPPQALALFQKHCTRIKNEELIAGLLKVIDYHTLTIEILAKTAERQKLDVETLKKGIKDDLKANVYVNHKGNKIDKVFSYLSSIFNLSGLSEEEAWLMKQFTCLPAEFHPYDLLLELIDPPENKREVFADTIERLVELGWLIKNMETEAYKMHLVVKEVAVRQLQPTWQNIEGLLNKIADNLDIDQSKDNPVEKFRWIPFGHALLNNFPNDTATVIVRLQNNLALVLINLGNYTEARVLLEKVLYSVEQKFSPDHPTTAVSYSNLATVLNALGDYAGAKALLEKAMHSAEQNFGPDHPYTARSYSNLATVLQNLGDYTGARALLEKALHSDERNFGPDHPTVAVRYSNLGTVFKDLGDYIGARGLLEKAMHSEEQNFGPNHPNTAVSYSNLALVLLDLGDYAGARALLEKAVHSNERNFGPDHPTTAVSYSNLAMVLRYLDDYTLALELAETGLLILKKILPQGHPYIGTAQSIYDSIKAKL
ncbi:tetratricopeptide repeat protein [Paraflavitalea soli]|uniref:Tetratricopeptide repeat protein n=1 Tax=Paraflavitalea soli TaxID=2315862 RepID=A0A3B7MYH9_9BACT|nr:tetratricopeptide repeat protein [Paraflavitalea soli]AXY78150.1 tetratricopeptide repeat protein [Paraflavitalea soli]